MPSILSIFRRNRAAKSQGTPAADTSSDYINQFHEVETFTFPINSTEYLITLISTHINNLPAHFATAQDIQTGKSIYFTDHNNAIYYHPSKEVLKRRVIEVMRMA